MGIFGAAPCARTAFRSATLVPSLGRRALMHKELRLPIQAARAVCLALLLATTAQAFATVGAMGDSYSDEYSALTPGLYNWVDLLVQSGRADFGPFTTFPSGDPRNTGGSTGSYTYNFAKGGATTTSA